MKPTYTCIFAMIRSFLLHIFDDLFYWFWNDSNTMLKFSCDCKQTFWIGTYVGTYFAHMKSKCRWKAWWRIFWAYVNGMFCFLNSSCHTYLYSVNPLFIRNENWTYYENMHIWRRLRWHFAKVCVGIKWNKTVCVSTSMHTHAILHS